MNLTEILLTRPAQYYDELKIGDTVIVLENVSDITKGNIVIGGSYTIIGIKPCNNIYCEDCSTGHFKLTLAMPNNEIYNFVYGCVLGLGNSNGVPLKER